MMNIRDFIFINKAKTINKIRILEILGFDANSNITHSPEILEELNNNLITSEIENENVLEIQETNTEFYQYTDDLNLEESNVENTSTETFEPIKITSQIKKLWIDIENRRKWLVPVTLISSTIFLISKSIFSWRLMYSFISFELLLRLYQYGESLKDTNLYFQSLIKSK